MRQWINVAAWLLLAGMAYAAPRGGLDGAPGGSRVREYFQVIAQDDTVAWRQFIAANYADSALAERSVAERLGIYRQMRQNFGRLEMTQFVSGVLGRTTVLAKAQDGQELQMTFLSETQPPFKLLGIQIEQHDAAEPPAVTSPLGAAAALDSIRAYLAAQTAADGFSGAVLIAQNGAPLLREGYGLANRELRVPNTPETRFNLGSIDKTFTQLVIQSYIAKGKLALADRVGKFLPDWPNADVREKVTIQHLLEHRAGIPDFFGEEFVQLSKDRLRTLADYAPLFAAKPLLFAPGTEERYSNGGYIVLGLIIEKLAGKSYYEAVKETVFDVAGMSHSGAFMLDEIVPDRATGYTHRWSYEGADSPELRSNALVLPARGSSAGGGYSTVDDLLRFVTALEAGRFPGETRGGMGIAGGAPGLNAAIETGLPGGYTVIVLGNLDPPAAEQAARTLRVYLRRIQP